MTTRTLAQKALDEAHAMALQGHTWHRGRSKANGRAFYVIPSRSEPGVAHWTTTYGCTCKGARRRGDCAHSEAVRMFEAREAVTRKPLDHLTALLERHQDDRTQTVSAF
jgi:hypothetical protein